MGLAQVQGLLALLYTNAALREDFFRNPLAVAKACGLSVDDARQVCQLSAGQVSFFADSLHRKRLNGVGKLLPLSRRHLGKRFAELFEEYARTLVPGTGRQREDAKAFARYVADVSHRYPIKPSWVVGQLGYEAARLRATEPRTRCTVRWLVLPPPAALHQPPREDAAQFPASRLTMAIWVRLSTRGRLWHVVLSLPGPLALVGQRLIVKVG